jgi:hypothetical protein
VLVVHETTSELEHAILAILLFAGAENIDSCQEGGIAACFPLDVLMLHSSVPSIANNGERLTYGGFSHGETFGFGSFEFIADYFGSLSLSPKESDLGTAFMDKTRSGSPSLWAMIEDITEEFYMASSREGGSGLPSTLRHGTGATPAPITTTPWLEDILVTQVMMTVRPQARA